MNLVLFLCLFRYNLFIHPSVDTSHVLSVVYNAAINMGIQISQHGVYVSIVAATVYILTSSAQGSPFRHILFNFCYLLPFLMLVKTDMRCSNRYEVFWSVLYYFRY